jgi:hypothetical protein
VPDAFQIDANTLRKRLRAQLTALAAEVDRTRAEEGFQAALRAMAAFWRYSPFNQFLIRLQRPDAVRVAGRRTWERLGRVVRDGERPILVLAPPSSSRGFWAVPVYDLRQTEGAPLPTIETDLRGESDLVPALVRAAEQLGVEVGFVPQGAGVAGTSHGGHVEVDPGRPSAQQARVLAHELAHEILHQQERAKAAAAKRPAPRRTHAEVETEADATAYVVLLALGLEAPSPAYIAWRGGDGAQVLRSMTRIQRAAKRILEACSCGGAEAEAARQRRARRPRRCHVSVKSSAMPALRQRSGVQDPSDAHCCADRPRGGKRDELSGVVTTATPSRSLPWPSCA